jgi:hypothetical protein
MIPILSVNSDIELGGEQVGTALLVLLLIILIFGGGGVLLNLGAVLWYILIAALILWAIGFLVRSAEGGGRWYRW